MPIILYLDRVMADRQMSLNDLAEKVGITNANMSRIKTGRIKAIRLSTLSAICDALHCQPGEIMAHMSDEEARKFFGNTTCFGDDAITM